jgi:hypothetical protein
MNLRFAGIALASALASFLFVSGAEAQGPPVTIFNQDWEGNNPTLYGYDFNGATHTTSVQAGQGTNGSHAAVLDATLGGINSNSGAGMQTNTVTNPNTQITDLSKINVSFDARVTTLPIGDVQFYIQTWAGVFQGNVDGTRQTTFTPTNTYQTYNFKLSDIPIQGSTDINVTHPTWQVSWQIGTFANWPANSHDTLQIDNLHITAVPAPESSALFLAGLTAGAAFLRYRRRNPR